MQTPYRARCNERVFLNYPGFHGGAYVLAYVEDTSEREHERLKWADRLMPPSPRLILELADCSNRINLEFELVSEAQRGNSLHKLDVLLTVLHSFRVAVEAESELYAERERELATRKRSKKAAKRTRRVRALR